MPRSRALDISVVTWPQCRSHTRAPFCCSCCVYACLCVCARLNMRLLRLRGKSGGQPPPLSQVVSVFSGTPLATSLCSACQVAPLMVAPRACRRWVSPHRLSALWWPFPAHVTLAFDRAQGKWWVLVTHSNLIYHCKKRHLTARGPRFATPIAEQRLGAKWFVFAGESSDLPEPHG